MKDRTFRSTGQKGPQGSCAYRDNPLVRSCEGTLRRPAVVALLASILVGPIALPAADEHWEWGYDVAKAAAARDGRPILLLFPDAVGEIPRVLRNFPPLKDIAESFHFACVLARELEVLREVFRVVKLPSLLLLNRSGILFHRWEGNLGGEIWVQVRQALRRLRALEAEVANRLAEARRALERKDFAVVLARAREVQIHPQAGPGDRDGARELESTALERARIDLREILALEGLVPDVELRERLKKLKARFPHVLVEAQIERESARLAARKLGGATGR